MSEESDDKPDRQIEAVQLDIGTEITDGAAIWVTVREIGRGAFGTVYHVMNKTTKQEAAIKVEQMSAGDNLLKIEREIMLAMQSEPTAIHIFDDGIYQDFRFIVMTLCGPDLQKIAEMMNNKFSQETILRVSIRSLIAIKTLHEFEYVHRDLKPCNFAVDYNPNSHHIYLFDYGMARRYARKDEKGRYWLRRGREHVQFRGTVRYCSLNMHKRKELGRVDDVWSWFFMMIEMYQPLPWGNVATPEAVEGFKEDHLVNYLDKDPFMKSLLPIVAILNGTDYADRPNYFGVFEILYQKLKEINGKLAGQMEYDNARMSSWPPETAKPKEQSKIEDEGAVLNYLTNAFKKPGIPGGQQHLLNDMVNFFGSLRMKKEKEEKTDDKKQAHKKDKKVAKKMLGTGGKHHGLKPTQVANGREKQSGSGGSKASQVKKPKEKKK